MMNLISIKHNTYCLYILLIINKNLINKNLNIFYKEDDDD
jgi:hypothetical protein